MAQREIDIDGEADDDANATSYWKPDGYEAAPESFIPLCLQKRVNFASADSVAALLTC